MTEYPIFSNILRRLIALKAHTKKQHFLIAIYINLLAVSLVSLQLFKQDACSHIRKRAVAVKEWYQNQDVLNIDNLTQCFWAILYKFSTTVRWSIKYYSKHLDKDVCLKTLLLFFDIWGKKTITTSFSASRTQIIQIFALYQGGGGEVTWSWHLSMVSLTDTAKASLLCPLWALIFLYVCVYLWVSQGSTT